jgi:GR25 family glycosyltransferase involved in LPS biosynthesis
MVTMDLKIKAVCINLERCKERYDRMNNLNLQDVLPFEFSKAVDYKDISLVTNLSIDGITIDRIDENGKYNINVEYYKSININDKPSGYVHDIKRYLMDQVEHFGRNHFRTYRYIPYAENIVAVDHDEHNKKWITWNGEYQFFVEISHFRKYMTLGEIACVISHFNVIKQLLQDDEYDYYLILEDDVKLTTDENYSLDKILKHLQLYKSYWDIVFLNEPKFVTENSLHSISEFLNIGIYSSFTQACSYIISKKTAQYLVDKLDNGVNITMDDFLSRCQDLIMFRTKKPVFILDDTADESNIREYIVEEIMEQQFQKYNKNEL